MVIRNLLLVVGGLALLAACGSESTADPNEIVASTGRPSILANGQSGTTLAASKTIDICRVSNGATETWRYSGEISVWNEGAIDTVGFTIADFIENKVGTTWQKAFDVPVTYAAVIPAGTVQETALTFPYQIESAPLAGSIRNNAQLTITNHSGRLGQPFGPNPKATYSGSMPPPDCPMDPGCTYTQGYWGNKPNVAWPTGYSRTDIFYLSGQTWQQVFDTKVSTSPGYYQLADQFMAAVLNKANGAPVPQGVQDILSLATTWLSANAPAVCTKGSSCGLQKTWGGILATYNEGTYKDGPAHCTDE